MGCKSDVNHKTPLKTTPPLEGWHKNNEKPIDHPWWLPVLSKATSLFASAFTSNEDLELDLVP